MDRARVEIVVTPLVAFAALAAGLRVGASDTLRAAVVYGAPASKDALVWQLAIVADDRGVREALSVTDLVVVARRRAEIVTWRGSSNADGIAEARLAFPDAREGDTIQLEIHGAGTLLAAGSATVPPAWRDVAHGIIARATRKDGAIALDVAPLGGRLPVGFPGSLFVRATDRAGQPLANVTIDVEPEPGLEVNAPQVVTCASGWAEIVATPTFHVASLSLHAHARAGNAADGDLDGLWYGSVPVAGAASHVAAPLRIPSGKSRAIDVFAAGTRGQIYAELDDEHGRLAAQILEAPRGAIDVPALSPGLYWLVTSSEARGAETLGGGALARPLLVDDGARAACDVGATLAASSASTGFPRTVVLDGFAGRKEQMRARHRLGTTIGLSALVVAAVLEGLLLLGAARRGAVDVAPALRKRAPALSLAIALLASFLGFALLAALVLYGGG